MLYKMTYLHFLFTQLSTYYTKWTLSLTYYIYLHYTFIISHVFISLNILYTHYGSYPSLFTCLLSMNSLYSSVLILYLFQILNIIFHIIFSLKLWKIIFTTTSRTWYLLYLNQICQFSFFQYYVRTITDQLIKMYNVCNILSWNSR